MFRVLAQTMAASARKTAAGSRVAVAVHRQQLSFFSGRFEADLEPMACRFGEARERAGGRPAAPALKSCYCALSGLHAPCQLGLAQSGAPSRLGDRSRQRKLLLEQIVFPAIVRLFHPRLVKIPDFRHGTFLARWR